MARPPAIVLAIVLGFAACSGVHVGDPVAADLAGADPEVVRLIEFLTEQVRDDPDNAGKRATLGLAYEANGLSQAALACYAQARALEPAEAEWVYHAALARARAGEIEDALDEMDRSLSLDETYVPAHLNRGQWLLDLGRPGEALKAFNSALRLEAGSAAGLFGAARSHLALEQGARALQLLEGLSRSRSDDPYVHQLLGLAYRQIGDLDRARAALAKGGASGSPGWRDPRRGKMMLYEVSFGGKMLNGKKLLDAGRHAEALRMLEPLLALDPTHPALIVNLSVAYHRAGKEEQAEAIVRRGVEAHPEHVALRVNLSLVHERAGNVEQALVELDRAIALNPVLATAHERRGNLLLRSNRRAEALEALETANRLDRTRAQPLAYAGMLLVERREWDRAADRLERSIAIDPNQTMAYILLAAVRAEQSDFDGAERALERAGELDPDSKQVRAMRERLDGVRRHKNQ